MSSSKRHNAGFSLTEVLVVLAILALVTAVFASTRPSPSPAMRQEARITALVAEVARVQQDAITLGKTQFYAVPDPTCAQDQQNLIFYANGTAQSAKICLMGEQEEHWLALDPFTAQLKHIPAP